LKCQGFMLAERQYTLDSLLHESHSGGLCNDRSSRLRSRRRYRILGGLKPASADLIGRKRPMLTRQRAGRSEGQRSWPRRPNPLAPTKFWPAPFMNTYCVGGFSRPTGLFSVGLHNRSNGPLQLRSNGLPVRLRRPPLREASSTHCKWGQWVPRLRSRRLATAFITGPGQCAERKNCSDRLLLQPPL
jgi:hypothetical protein